MTTSDDVLRGNYRSTELRRVSHGVFLRRTDEPDGVQRQRDLRAWISVMPADAVLTHVTAARLAGWWTPSLVVDAPVFAAVPEGSTIPRRPGLVVSRLRRDPGVRKGAVEGLPVDHPSEVLLRSARDLTLLDMVPMIESAVRHDHLSRAELVAACERPRAGVRVLRGAAQLADPRSESLWETVLRLFCHTMEIDVAVQPELRHDRGRLLGRADLLIEGTSQLLEYDGAQHRDRKGQQGDLRRDRRLLTAGFQRRAYTSHDLIVTPGVAMSELDRLLGRPRDVRRLRRWRQLVERSSHSPAGRDRLLSRWYVGMNVLNAG